MSPALAGSAEATALAIELAGSWAASGLRVLLADGTVGSPSLHIPFGLPNDGGLADVLLAGNGWERLTLPTGTPGLRLLPAGGGAASTAPQDALGQLAQLCADTSAEGTLLVFFVPLGSMVTEWVFGQCTDIVALSTEGEDLQPFFQPDEDRIRALLGRPEGWKATPASSAAATQPAPRAPSVGAEPTVERPSEPPPTKRTPSTGEPEADAAAAPRSARRTPPLPGNPPPTERIEEAWARAAAQLRATLEAKQGTTDDLFSTAMPETPAPPPAQSAQERTDAAKAPGEPASSGAAEAPPVAEPAAPGPPPSTTTAEKPPPSTPPKPSLPDPLPLLEPLEETPPAPKAAKPRSRPSAAERSTPPPPPSPSRSAEPPPRTWTPVDAPPIEEPPQLFAEPDLPPPLPQLDSWDPEFGAEEAHGRARAARWRRLARNGLLGLAGVAVVAVVVVVRNTGSSMPPVESPVTSFPRAMVEPETPAGAATAPEGIPGEPEDQTPDPTPATAEEAPAQGERPEATPEAAAARTPVTAATQPTAEPPTARPTAEPPAARPTAELPAERPTAEPPAARPSGAAPSALAPSTPLQRFSWSIAAMGTLRAARGLADDLRTAAPDEAFMVAPIVANGRTLYRVLGGVSDNRPSLSAGRGSLGERTGMDASKWFVREAPSAYVLEEFSDAAAAEVRSQELWSAGVPTYVLEVDRRDGSTGYRVYAGAYATEEEAEPLLAMLREAGITGMTFTERRGRVPR